MARTQQNQDEKESGSGHSLRQPRWPSHFVVSERTVVAFLQQAACHQQIFLRVPKFGIATECGIARKRKPELVRSLLEIHAAASHEPLQ